MKKIAVLGAGLVGAFVARTLAEDGFEVTAFDRSEDALGALAGIPRARDETRGSLRPRRRSPRPSRTPTSSSARCPGSSGTRC